MIHHILQNLKIYKEHMIFLNEDDCVSLSVVPYTVPVHRDDVFPYGKEIGMGYYDIAENTELLEYLKKNITGKS